MATDTTRDMDAWAMPRRAGIVGAYAVHGTPLTSSTGNPPSCICVTSRGRGPRCGARTARTGRGGPRPACYQDRPAGEGRQ